MEPSPRRESHAGFPPPEEQKVLSPVTMTVGITGSGDGTRVRGLWAEGPTGLRRRGLLAGRLQGGWNLWMTFGLW